ncbi:MAG: acyl-ACP--UDP-N-acetylglucosamine O-acyltransferase [Gemmatimonadota bacterium]|nr:acyl-ACP--UDP-N-acetylglucosamine O-acyltransferase [Gemmatimonadota bacterium]
MSARIHPTALVAPDARIGDDVEVGAFAIIGEDCVIADGCTIGARATLERHVRLAPGVRIGVGAVLGSDPQDLKFQGEVTHVEIGEGTIIREYCTINRATSQSWRTTVGRNCFLMSYVHLAHDCHVGDGVIIANGAQLAGHVTIEDRAILSGVLAVHQFVRIGTYSFVGGMTRVSQDVPPYLKAVGSPMKLYGLNSVGLRRNNFDERVMRELKRAYRLIFRSELNLSQAVERARAELEMMPEIEYFLRFVESSHRGVAT